MSRHSFTIHGFMYDHTLRLTIDWGENDYELSPLREELIFAHFTNENIDTLVIINPIFREESHFVRAEPGADWIPADPPYVHYAL